jgi:hypothetical protein
MMKKLIPVGLLLAIFTVACNKGGESGDVDLAKKASAEAPKSEAQLPANMPPEARRSAGAAIAQQQAMAQQAEAQNRARMAAGK